MRGLTLAFVCLVAAGCLLLNRVQALEACTRASCIDPRKCELSQRDTSKPCEVHGEVCCEDIKEEDKHRCEHFLGECMAYCNAPSLLKDKADNCEEGEKCCVLVN